MANAGAATTLAAMARWLGRLRWGLIGPVAVVLLVLSCRDGSVGVSGTPYSCECELTAEFDAQRLEVAVCGLTVGEAMRAATECVEAAEDVAVQFCDCVEDSQVFCEFGECFLD